MGGYAPTTSSGARFLADLIPFNGTAKGFTVRSRGDGTGESGQTIGSTLVFGHIYGGYTSNAVFFSRGGNPAILSRPAGTDPQLQAAYSPADQPATRWHLEAFGTGTFRLRNGNPDGGTECAYRDGTTSNVRVKACGTGNEFMWTLVGAATGSSTFKLQNATNGQCLDVNGSATPTNVVLKPCVTTGDPIYQSLYVDDYNWPN
ncbi:RICIN domain-containing protein [Sorangium sp. So ce448]|uniref:RICIN domain-containing protein n=1 Tax=Sorangium sp. So ce448 TaxID=3133314 RepID=UPI003F639078